jgi:hypothetical protein
MTFNETFEELCDLYTEGKDYRGRTPEQVAAIDKKMAEFRERSKKFAKENPYTKSGPSHASPAPRPQSEDGEDNETAKKIGKGAAKLAGKAALGAAKLAGKGVKEVAHFTTDDQFRRKKGEDGEHEDCETCGCEENPEYGHFDDKFSDYIDQYEEPAEDAERMDKDRMKCNSPKRGGSKKFVVKACENGKEKIVRFGDPNMKIRKSNPKARKSFRARHKCDQKKSKFSAGYWSCKKW